MLEPVVASVEVVRTTSEEVSKEEETEVEVDTPLPQILSGMF